MENQQKLLRNQKGFTLIEIIAVLLILSFLAAVAVPKYIDLEENAQQKAFDGAIAELNGREVLVWANLKISPSGYQDDAQLILLVDYNLGNDYSWQPGHPVAVGGDLTFKGETVTLNRLASSLSEPAVWSR
jgi:prepilin-type N-terminal cleavage/methylation domain-containing protein